MKTKRILKYFGIYIAILIVVFLSVAQIAYQSIVYNDETAEHILSLIPLTGEK